MTRLTKLRVGYRGIHKNVAALIEQWRPSSLPTELAYSDALATFLRKALPEDSRVEREYRHEGTTCDVCVHYSGVFANDLVLIEVKRNLRKKSDYDRLVGQIEGLKPKKNSIVVALVGDTDPALLGRLQEQFRTYIREDLSYSFSIVTVK